MEIEKIIGLKVVAIKTFRRDKRRKRDLSPDYILFDDGQTFIEIEDQDYYTYHDCDSGAKRLSIRQDIDLWQQMIKNADGSFPDSNTDIGWY